jgi:hypothetical protein
VQNENKLIRATTILWVAVVSLASSGCAGTRVIPIQVARIHQTESYVQTYSLRDLKATPATDVADEIQAQNRRIDDVFGRLLGTPNWQVIKDLYGLGVVRDELLAKKIITRGLIDFTIYLDPFDHQRFFIEGAGRYFLVREKTGEILLSGDFSIPAKPHAISELDQGYLVFDVEQIVTRIPGQVTYLHGAPLKYKIYIDNSMRKTRVYAIDYSNRNRNEVYLPEDSDEPISDSNLIGYMKMNAPGSASKLIDLRGIEFIRADYKRSSPISTE